uniref:Peptidase_M1_N domain-containing protein n=1 Tax=Parastrongyloides trichosuri TaxID=131310 RepID=A0A0N5A435_PARTI
MITNRCRTLEMIRTIWRRLYSTSWIQHDYFKEFLLTRFYVKFNTIPHGFYRPFYNDLESENKTIVSTHFESAHARNTFPYIEEPIFKATFKLKDLSALSNLRVKNIDRMDDGTKIVNFGSTIHMSTYLVAFVVGEIRFIINFDGTRYRAYAIPGNET